MKPSDPVNSGVDYPPETFQFKNIKAEIKPEKASHDADFQSALKMMKKALKKDVNCSIFVYG